MNAQHIVFTQAHEARLLSFQLATDKLGPTEVLIQTLASLVSPGTEGANFLDLKHPGRDDEVPYPRNVGYANVGRVMTAGADASVAAGDIVYSMSHHASHVRLDTAQTLCLKVPAGLTSERATFARMATVSMSTLRTTTARAGDHAAIVGLGLVGLLAAQLCELAGMPATCVDLLPFRCELARRCGLQTVMSDPADERITATHQLVIEASGSAEGALTALQLARPGGEVALVGAPWGRGKASIPAHSVLEPVFARYITLRSGWEWQLPIRKTTFGPGSIEETSQTALTWLAEGKLRVPELITHRLSPADAQLAYDGLINHKDQYLGIIFDWESLSARL